MHRATDRAGSAAVATIIGAPHPPGSQFKTQIEDASSDYDKERLAELAGVEIIKVGGSPQVKMKVRTFRRCFSTSRFCRAEAPA
jgi:hypothetical protein